MIGERKERLVMSNNLNKLKEKISLQLDPLIKGSVVLTDLPYHKNIGDILIWEGEIDYLTQRKIKCLSLTSFHTFNFPTLPSDVTILLHGGGNFGDLYRVCQEFRLKVIETYPNNKIIMLPQSLYYSDLSLMINDAKIMSKHKNLYLCARDNETFLTMQKYFSNHILLVPDMAFCINPSKLKRLALQGNKEENGGLCWIKRKDAEYKSGNEPDEKNLIVSDWPTFERNYVSFWILEKLLGLHKRIRLLLFRKLLAHLIDGYASNYIRPYGVRLGCQFISQFSEIVSSRLHGMILAILLSKPVQYQDNISHKLSSFYNTWFASDSQTN